MRTGSIIALITLLLALIGYTSWHLWRLAPLGWKWATAGAFLLWAATFFVGFALTERMPIPMATAAYEVGNTWLIAFLYLTLLFLVADIACLCRILPASYLNSSPLGLLSSAGLVAIILAAGGIHYHHKYREHATIATPKPLEKPLTIVMASDLHLGYHNRKAELARWIDLINAENPDLVLIAGDIIDLNLRPVLAGGYAEEFRRLRAPVYTILGNHEYYGDPVQARQFFQEAGITLLKDSAVQCHGLEIIGRDDRTNPHRLTIEQLKDEFSILNSQFSILLDHQPYHLEEAEAAGSDFQFSGHTHRGQVWPLSWITDALYEKSWGHHQRGRTRYYISSGLGIWGPKIRIGTRSEYLVLHLTPLAP